MALLKLKRGGAMQAATGCGGQRGQGYRAARLGGAGGPRQGALPMAVARWSQAASQSLAANSGDFEATQPDIHRRADPFGRPRAPI
jgi:hypothetical protein